MHCLLLKKHSPNYLHYLCTNSLWYHWNDFWLWFMIFFSAWYAMYMLIYWQCQAKLFYHFTNWGVVQTDLNLETFPNQKWSSLIYSYYRITFGIMHCLWSSKLYFEFLGMLVSWHKFLDSTLLQRLGVFHYTVLYCAFYGKAR